MASWLARGRTALRTRSGTPSGPLLRQHQLAAARRLASPGPPGVRTVQCSAPPDAHSTHCGWTCSPQTHTRAPAECLSVVSGVMNAPDPRPPTPTGRAPAQKPSLLLRAFRRMAATSAIAARPSDGFARAGGAIGGRAHARDASRSALPHQRPIFAPTSPYHIHVSPAPHFVHPPAHPSTLPPLCAPHLCF